MDALTNILPWLAVGLIAVIVLALLHKPLKGLVRLLGRTGVGLAVLYALSQIGAFIGVNLGVNLANALVLGVLGAPGLGLLFLLNWAMM